MVAVTVLTVIAVLAAPLIFRLYSIDTERHGVDPERVPRGRHRCSRGSSCSRSSSTAPPAWPPRCLNARRRFFAAAWSPILPNVVDHRHAAVAAVAGDGDWTLADVLERRPAALDARPRRHARHRRDGVVLIAAPCAHAGVALPARASSSATRRCAGCCALSAWTLGYVVANQVAVDRRPQPGRARLRRRRRRTSRRSRSSCSPTACWRCRSPRRSQPEMARAVDAAATGGVHRPDVARHPADRAADASRPAC